MTGITREGLPGCCKFFWVARAGYLGTYYKTYAPRIPKDRWKFTFDRGILAEEGTWGARVH